MGSVGVVSIIRLAVVAPTAGRKSATRAFLDTILTKYFSIQLYRRTMDESSIGLCGDLL